MTATRSPLPWIGGKNYSAQRILAAFPSPASYNVNVEPFGSVSMPFGPVVSSTMVSCAQHPLQWEHLAASTEVYPERNAW